jgi:hypothetical protein
MKIELVSTESVRNEALKEMKYGLEQLARDLKRSTVSKGHGVAIRKCAVWSKTRDAGRVAEDAL